MHILYTVVVVLQVISAVVIIGLVLLQHGKGADMGASFGSGASGSLFGATGSSNFLSKSTGIAAIIFFASTLGLAYVGSNRVAPSGVMENISVVQPSAVNAKPQVAPASSVNQSNQIPK